MIYVVAVFPVSLGCSPLSCAGFKCELCVLLNIETFRSVTDRFPFTLSCNILFFYLVCLPKRSPFVISCIAQRQLDFSIKATAC